MSVFAGIIIGFVVILVFGMIAASIDTKKSKDFVSRTINYSDKEYIRMQKEELEQQKQSYEILYKNKEAELKKEFNKKEIAFNTKVEKTKNELELLKQQNNIELQNINELIAQKRNELNNFENNYKKHIIEIIKTRELQLLQDKSSSQKWLSGMITDFITLPIEQEINDLYASNSKAKWDKAIKLTDLKKQISILTERNKMLEYELNYLYDLYPEIKDAEIELDEQIFTDELENTGWLTKEEWENLSSIEKNTLAYERYKNRHKTKWQIGRDFEMYIGYRYENKNYSVEYNGINKGLKDEGIDLIAKNESQTLLIQCKYWSSQKQIHEKHLCQLYGTSFKYKLEHPSEKIRSILICHNTLSDIAKQFANKLEIEYSESVELKEYPAIKCCKDYNKQTMIYHLPFDNNYDKIVNCIKVATVEQAEKLGYRRAYVWHAAK